MNTMKQLTLMIMMTILATTAFTGCSKDAIESDAVMAAGAQQGSVGAHRTVLVYMAGRNNLSRFATDDLREMLEGSKLIDDEQTLLVFMRRGWMNEEPWLARIKNGEVTDKVSLSEMGIHKEDTYVSDPEVMERVMQYAFNRYPSPSNDYGLVLWGHSSGWLMEDSVQAVPTSRAFGVDLGNAMKRENAKWLNLPGMKNVLMRLPHLKYIFADCCNFMCMESLYELRNVADYIIGSSAEIPADGAPYDVIVPALFEKTAFCEEIVEKYYQGYNGCLPLCAVKMSEMGRLAQATDEVTDSIDGRLGDVWHDTTGLIHYNNLTEDGEEFHRECNIYYDAGDYIRRYATPEEYRKWKSVLDGAIVTKRYASTWHTDLKWDLFFTDFTMTPERYHGISMFIDQDDSTEYGKIYKKLNQDIEKMEWYQAVWL